MQEVQLANFLPILKQPGCPHIQGFVADLPAVVDSALKDYHQLGLPENRITFMKQDMTHPYPEDFKSTPSFSRIYLACLILNNRSKFYETTVLSYLKKEGKFLVITVCVTDAGILNKNIGINGIQNEVMGLHVSNFFYGGYHTRSDAETSYKKIGNQAGFKLSKIYDTFLGGTTIFEFSTI